MITYKCNWCGNEIVPTRTNEDGMICYDKVYYHHDCFIAKCEERLQQKRTKKSKWITALENISQWQSDAGMAIRERFAKDDVYKFIAAHYRISSVNNELYTRINAIYDGSYNGLVYPIGPEELLAEWEYYFLQLVEARKYKNMTGDQAVRYDLAILLSKNAEYREMMERKNLEEQVKEAQRNTNVNVDETAMALMQKNLSRQQTGNRRADLFKEVMGNGN